MANEIVVTPMSDDEFGSMRERLKALIAKIRENGAEAAKILSRMTHSQLKIIKQDFKGIWSADQIERLAMYGRGIISLDLASRQKSLPASVLRRMPKTALAVLNDPESEVELLTVKGVRIRQVKDLTTMEMTQVVDVNKGILKAEDQARRIITPSKPQKPVSDNDIEEPSSIKLSDDRRYVLVVTKCVTVQIPIKTLRRIVA
jgi:hypothetical protein